MSVGDRLRMWAEICLLCAPEAAVWRLLTSCHYRDVMPEPTDDLTHFDVAQNADNPPAPLPCFGRAARDVVQLLGSRQ